MKQNQLGTSDLWVSEIGFGCMSLGLDRAVGVRVLQRAFELGVTFFDTADLYDHGENEKTVGEALRGVRDQVVIATKVGNCWENSESWRWDPSKAWIEEAVQHSLKRLQTDYIDLYQLHGGTLDDPLDDIVETFEGLKAAGLIRAYGISSIRPQVIRAWLGCSKLSSVMMQYSLLDRRPEEEVLALLRDASVSVVARGPVAKGLLADKPAADYLDYTEDEVAAVQQGLEPFTCHSRSKAQVALGYALANESVASVVPGASSVAQLEENVMAAALPSLTPAELRAIRALTKANHYEKYR